MKLGLCVLALAALAVSASAATFVDIGVGVGTGLSQDGVAISYNNNGVSYIYSQANGAFAVNTAGNNVGIAKVGSDYVIAYNSSASGSTKAYAWRGGLNGVGTTTVDPFSTTSSSYFYARGIGGDANQAYVAGSQTTSVSVAARWKAPGGSVATYAQPSNIYSSSYYLYSASNTGSYAGWGRLSASGTVSNKSQAIVLDGSLVSLRNAWGAPSTNYYSNAYISGDAQTCFGYSGVSDNSTALPVYWSRAQYGTFTTNTTANLIPLLDGYTKGYAMKSDQTASLIAGWTIKDASVWGVDRRTIFMYDKASNTTSDLRQVLSAAGVDLSGWGLMDITGISSDGRKLSGTMLAADDTYWTTGTISGSYHTWYADLDASAVPEPGSLLALGTGLIGFFGLIRRRK